jgi:hypothetical protein
MAEQTKLPDWYRRHRQTFLESLEGAVARPDVYEERSDSPSGRYRLELVQIRKADAVGTRGRITEAATGRAIAEVIRNFISFPWTWVEGHPSGHDYLLCGEDYQGQTVIELDTGRRVDFIPEAAERGTGFCWTSHYPTPDRQHLFVNGCVWAAPYELVQFDFFEPLVLPYREIRRWPGAFSNAGVQTVHGFDEDGRFRFDCYVEYRTTDLKGVDEMSDEEWDAWSDTSAYDQESAEGTLHVVWSPDGTEQVRRSWRDD